MSRATHIKAYSPMALWVNKRHKEKSHEKESKSLKNTREELDKGSEVTDRS